MALTKADWSVSVGGDIREVAGTSTHTVIELHRWLMDLLDDTSATDDDLIDVSNGIIPSARSTDEIITLNAPYNIDHTVARRFYQGSITYTGGADVFSGVRVVGAVAAGTEIQVVQDNVITPAWWGTGVNAVAADAILTQMLIKTRTGGTDIDDKKIRVFARELGDSFAEFAVTLGTGFGVAALFTGTDDFNTSSEAIIAGYTDITNLTEGYNQLDVDGLGDQNYYSEWDYGTRSQAQFFERQKWIYKRANTEDENIADTGTSFIVDNITITGAAQSFSNGGNAVNVVQVRARVKANASPTGNMTASIYTITGSSGSTAVPNVINGGVSVGIDTATLTTGYEEVYFTFLPANQASLIASTDYAVVFEHTNGDGTNYVEVEGLAAAGTHGGNRSHNTAGWTAVAADDLNFTILTSPLAYDMAGELFRGVTHEIVVNNPTGTLVEPELLTWTEGTTLSSGQLLATDSTTAATKIWVQLLTGIAPTSTTTLTGAGSGTVDVNVTVTTRTLNTPSVVGNFTGSFAGAYGVGVVPAELENVSDSLRALDNTARNPPNNVALVATGLVAGDIIFAAKTKSDTDTVSGSYSVGDTAITLSTSVPTDYDQIGRLIIDSIEYTMLSYAGAVVTLAAPGLTGTLAGGEDTTLTQFYNDEFTTTADGGTVNGVNDTEVQFTVAPGSSWPTTGYVLLWDGVDRYHEYKYASITTDTLTLDSHTALTMDASSTTTTIIDAGATFETWGVKQGTRIYNTTRSLSSTVLSVTDENTLVLATAIAAQVPTDGYEIDTLVQSYGTVVGYIAFVSETATTSSISKSLVHTTDIPGVWRLYNSAANITPFEVGFSILATGSSTPLTRISDA